jgi:hypothetical protein
VRICRSWTHSYSLPDRIHDLPSLEIWSAIAEIKEAYNNVEKWSAPEAAPFNVNFFAMKPKIRKEPKGVVLIISPFNYPIWLTLPPLVRITQFCMNSLFKLGILGRCSCCRKLCTSQTLGAYAGNQCINSRIGTQVSGHRSSEDCQWRRT